jgi:hypothetical protein
VYENFISITEYGFLSHPCSMTQIFLLTTLHFIVRFRGSKTAGVWSLKRLVIATEIKREKGQVRLGFIFLWETLFPYAALRPNPKFLTRG